MVICWSCGTEVDETATACVCVDETGVPSPLLIDGYKVLRELGRGRNGVVHLVRDAFGRELALKTMLDRDHFSTAELSVTAQVPLESPHLTKILHIDSRGEYFVMEYVPGESLLTLLQRDRAAVQQNFLQLATGLASGLRTLRQRGIVHRDLKPANVIVREDWSPVITDYGLAVVEGVPLDDRRLAWRYLPAEAWVEHAAPDASWDVHSLGVIFYEIWTGSLPYEVPQRLHDDHAASDRAVSLLIARGRPALPEGLNPDIPAELSHLTMLLIDPDNRPSSPGIVGQRLRRLTDDTGQAGRLSRLDDFLDLTLEVYGASNGRLSPVDIAAHVASNYNKAVRALEREERARFEEALMRLLSWLCAFTDWLGFVPSEIIAVKFGEACPYCHRNPCIAECAGTFTPAVRTRILAEYRAGAGRNRKPGWSHFQFRQHFRRMYGTRNDEAGRAAVIRHGYEEVCEAAEAALKVPDLEPTEIDNLHLEVADLWAWFFALAHFADDDFDLEASFGAFYRHCPDCGEGPCAGQGRCTGWSEGQR